MLPDRRPLSQPQPGRPGLAARQMADILRARIESGQLLPDRPVPSESRLEQEFGIAGSSPALATGRTSREPGAKRGTESPMRAYSRPEWHSR